MTTKLQKISLFLKNHKQLSISVASLLVVILIGIGVGTIYFWGKTLPNVYLASMPVSHQTKAELTNLVTKRASASKITIADGKTAIKPGLKDLGVSVNIQETVDNLLNQHRENLWTRIALWQPRHVKFSISLNRQELASYLNKKLKVTAKPPQNAKIAFSQSAGKFVIQPEKAGSVIDTDKLSQAIISTVENARTANLPISHKQASAKIIAANLQQPLNSAQEYINTSITLSAPGASYQPTTAEKASWVSFTPSGASYKVSLNQSKIKQYVASVSSNLSAATKSQDVIKGVNGAADIIVQAGQTGRTVTNQAQLTSDLVQSLGQKQAYAGKIEVKTTPFKTVNMTAEKKWIEVNLSTQSLTAYEKSTPVNSFLISSGVAGHETVTGVFHIYIKYASQRMVGGSKAGGDYYDLPNVQWVNYFYQDYALHGAYWHHNWGHPMSHGCVNEPDDQAKWIYDWAPIGTTVVVHY